MNIHTYIQADEAHRQLTAEQEALDAAETAKMTAREEKFFKLKKACEDITASTSFAQMYELMIKAVCMYVCVCVWDMTARMYVCMYVCMGHHCKHKLCADV